MRNERTSDIRTERLAALRETADILEDGNYHTESAFLRGADRFLAANPDAQTDELLGFIVGYAWED